MPYGQLTGYSPVEGTPGAFRFDLANGGQTAPVVGADAEEMRKRIDAANRAALASAIAPQNPGAAAAVAPHQAPAPEGPAQFDPIAATKGGSMLLRRGGDPRNPNDVIVREGPRAATKGGMIPRAMTTQGGYEKDEQFIQNMEQSQLRQAALAEQSEQKAQELMMQRQTLFEAAKKQQAAEAAELAKDQAEKEKRLGMLQAKYADAEKSFLGFTEEQEAKVNSTKDKLQTFVGALSFAFGALGASLARTPNFAAEAVERFNEREMRRQEAELRIRKDAKDSLLGQLQQQLGSIDLAKSAFRALQSKQTALSFEQLASKESDENRRTTLLRVAELEHQNNLKFLEEYNRKADGEVTRSFQFAQGSPGSRGGDRRATLEEQAQLAALGKVRSETAKTNAETAKTAAEASQGGPGGKLSDTAANTLSNIASAKELLPQVAEKSREAGVKLPHEALGARESKATTQYQAAANSLIRIAAKAVEGDAAAESHVQQLQEDLLSPWPHKRQAAQEELYRTLDTKERQMQKIVPGAAPR